MIEDHEGFLYPKVDESRCIDCGKCEKVCPVLNQNTESQPIRVIAAINDDEKTRLDSSSGGIFSLLGEKIINSQGMVCGAKFNENWKVVHGFCENKKGLAELRRSKYVQSDIGQSYKSAQQCLDRGNKVLFSGTPCQIAGLHLFLNKEYSNLVTVDIVCHGVPSPRVWRDYLDFIINSYTKEKNMISVPTNKKPTIGSISFRDKSNGWKKYGFLVREATITKVKNSTAPSQGTDKKVIIYETLDKNIFMRGFLNNLFLRPICFECPFKSGRSCSDITLGDFWGVDRYCHKMNDDKGVSLVFINTEKGEKLFNDLVCSKYELNARKFSTYNSTFSNSAKRKYPSELFWEKYDSEGISAIYEICEQLKPSYIHRIRAKIRSLIKKIIFH